MIVLQNTGSPFERPRTAALLEAAGERLETRDELTQCLQTQPVDQAAPILV